MEEKNSGFSLNRRLLRALRRRARGEGGVTLVEMMVSLFIFAIVSTMFTVSIVQYSHILMCFHSVLASICRSSPSEIT